MAAFARTAALVADPMVLIDAASATVREVNQAFLDQFGLGRDVVVGRTPAAAGWLAPSTALDDLARALIDEEAVVEGVLAIQASEGRRLEAVARAKRTGPGGKHLQLVMALPTLTAQTERDLIFEHVPVGLALTRSRRFVEVNPVFGRVFGWPAEALIGQPGRVVWPSEAAYEDMGRRVGPALIFFHSSGDRLKPTR